MLLPRPHGDRAVCQAIINHCHRGASEQPKRHLDARERITKASFLCSISKQQNPGHIKYPAVLSQLLRDMKSYHGAIVVKAAVLLTPLIWCRPGELRYAKWGEIDFEAKQWRYVAKKTQADHIVPLPDQAIAILKDLQVLTGNGGYVFRGRNSSSPMSNSTINIALQGLGYDSDMITPHGFRHTAATMLAERLGFPEHEIEKQLSHKTGGVKGVYQKSQYLENRTKMMQTWADYLDKIASQTTSEVLRAV